MDNDKCPTCLGPCERIHRAAFCKGCDTPEHTTYRSTAQQHIEELTVKIGKGVAQFKILQDTVDAKCKRIEELRDSRDVQRDMADGRLLRIRELERERDEYRRIADKTLVRIGQTERQVSELTTALKTMAKKETKFDTLRADTDPVLRAALEAYDGWRIGDDVWGPMDRLRQAIAASKRCAELNAGTRPCGEDK